MIGQSPSGDGTVARLGAEMMTPQQQKQIDQRKTYRIPVPEDHQEAEIRVRGRGVPTRLFNESAGGFGGVVCDAADLQVHETVELATVDSRFLVRVAYIEPIIAEKGDSAETIGYRIGFERIEDLAPKPKTPSAASANRLREKRSVLIPVVAGVVLLVALAGAVASHLIESLWTNQRATAQAATGPAAPLAASPAFLTVMRQVGLSRRQQEQLAQTAEQTVRLLQELDEMWKNDSPEDRRIKQALLIEAANQEILRMLTDEQKARWLNLVKDR